MAKSSRRSARRAGNSRSKKPKYLSLRLQFSADKEQKCSGDHQQVNFATFEDKDAQDENMAYLLSAADGGATTLTGILDATTASSSVENNPTNRGSDELSASVSLTYGYGGGREGELVRSALRSRERDPSCEERYVRYSEVVERRIDHEEVSSRSGDVRPKRLLLKLDYDVIMSTWSEKGPFCIPPDIPQTVPDIINTYDDFQLSNQIVASSGQNGGLGNQGGGGLWRVPELMSSNSNVIYGELSPYNSSGSIKEEEESGREGGEEWKWKMAEQREARVLRYKEKRRNRLFSKTIRYQVRKLNAEKRPRLKGRFVKRS